MSRVLGSSGAGSVRHRGPAWPGRTTHAYSAVPSQDWCFATPCTNRLPQSIARQKIHPFQYLMVGAALCLFYLLLLSISEFIGFSWAYLIASVASTLLITWYCRFFLGGGVRTLMIGAGLAGVYTFLYITLRQQDYALLMGAIALFIVLAIVMYVTRKVDWYARDAG
jgi:inner membrane protein involved in colicin E2 resistance